MFKHAETTKTLIWVLVAACRIFLAVCGIFLAACRIFSCSMRDLVPWPGIKPEPPCMEMWNLNHQTMKVVPEAASFSRLSFRSHISPPPSFPTDQGCQKPCLDSKKSAYMPSLVGRGVSHSSQRTCEMGPIYWCSHFWKICYNDQFILIWKRSTNLRTALVLTINPF